ncbi:MAG: right-handed parallel beta-helix repeat-containing protein [Candidatus Cloacimonetes bacterium]|nr:right-handed parallel beta-helix repeat-containing protein [Candidatus Cloacimonadota bacterium]
MRSWIIVALLAMLLLAGCKAISTEPSGHDVSGSVELLDSQRDNAGVIVALYNAVELNSKIIEQQAIHSNLGYPIDQQSEFDHRYQLPYMQTTTSSSGGFKFEGVSTGNYNLAVLKENYGYKYIIDISVSTDREIPCIEMLQETVLSGQILTDITFSEASCTYIESDTEIITPASVTLSSGAIIRIAPGKMLRFLCPVMFDTAENSVRITSADKTFDFSGNLDTIELFSKISFSTDEISNQQISNLIISHSTLGLSVETNTAIAFQYVRGLNSHRGLVIEAGSSTISNCTFTQMANCALDLYSDFGIHDNIFGSCEQGLFAVELDGTINNNYFFENVFGIRVASPNLNIAHNEFDDCDLSISVAASVCTIEYNNISGSDMGIETSSIYGDVCYPTIRFNNFVANTTHISIIGFHDMFTPVIRPHIGVAGDIVCPHNYFDTLSNELSLLDANDDDWQESWSEEYYIDITLQNSTLVGNAGLE